MSVPAHLSSLRFVAQCADRRHHTVTGRVDPNGLAVPEFWVKQPPTVRRPLHELIAVRLELLRQPIPSPARGSSLVRNLGPLRMRPDLRHQSTLPFQSTPTLREHSERPLEPVEANGSAMSPTSKIQRDRC
jgi:hypothetical protein